MGHQPSVLFPLWHHRLVIQISSVVFSLLEYLLTIELFADRTVFGEHACASPLGLVTCTRLDAVSMGDDEASIRKQYDLVDALMDPTGKFLVLGGGIGTLLESLGCMITVHSGYSRF